MASEVEKHENRVPISIQHGGSVNGKGSPVDRFVGQRLAAEDGDGGRRRRTATEDGDGGRRRRRDAVTIRNRRLTKSDPPPGSAPDSFLCRRYRRRRRHALARF